MNNILFVAQSKSRTALGSTLEGYVTARGLYVRGNIDHN